MCSNFTLRSGGEVDLSLGPTEAGVDFGMIEFTGKISSNGLLLNELRQTV